MYKLFRNGWAKSLIVAALVIACTDDDKKDPAPLIKADFDFAADADDVSVIKFTNKSIGFKSVSWDFGDGSSASTDTNPEHSFASGTFSVKLTAIAEDGRTSNISKNVTVADPNVQLKKLTGTTSKTWKLIRDASTGFNPMEIGPQNRSTIYWSLGGATPLAERPCVFNDEYTFSLDGTFTYDAKGDVFADAGQFGPWSDDIGSTCVDSDDSNFVGKNGEDLSAWNNGTHTFEYNTATNKLTVEGLGAFIGLQKVATDAELWTPQESVTYNVVSLTDGEDVDTLIVEALHGGANYWRFVLVHYDDASMEPAIPGDTPPDDECVADAEEVIDGTAGIKLTLKTSSSQFGGFGGVSGGRIANPHVNEGNMSCFVNQYNRGTAGCETWGGAAIGLSSAIDFGATTQKKFKLKVYAEAKLTDVVLRLERLAFPDTEPSAERTATITAVGEWQEVTFDFSDITDPNTYKNIVIYFDRGTCSENVVYYFDDLTQID
jgi:PKD repeat protein